MHLTPARLFLVQDLSPKTISPKRNHRQRKCSNRLGRELISPKGVYHIEHVVEKPAYTYRKCYSADEERDWIFGEIHQAIVQKNEDLIEYIFNFLKKKFLKFLLWINSVDSPNM